MKVLAVIIIGLAVLAVLVGLSYGAFFHGPELGWDRAIIAGCAMIIGVCVGVGGIMLFHIIQQQAELDGEMRGTAMIIATARNKASDPAGA